RHMDAPDVQVVLELTGTEGCYVVDRAWSRSGRRAARMELRLSLPTGEILVDAQAEQRLAQLIGATFRDFFTTVYQHQEAIRAVLTQEPRERNDAIDRLLGLSIYRNVQDALVKAKAADRQRAMRAQFEAFEQRVQTALTTRNHDLDELRQEAARGGVAL